LDKRITCCLAAILIGSFFLTSCCSDTDLKIINPLRAWIPYKSQQELKFKSEFGDTIIFNAVTREYNQQATDKACGAYDIQTIQTSLSTPSDSTFSTLITISHEVVFGIKVYSLNTKANNLDIKFNTVSELFISEDFRDKYLQELPVNGKTYQQVLHVYGNRMPGNLFFADILYAKNIGLVGFKTFDEKWYVLI
jgi:hypothetical protein